MTAPVAAGAAEQHVLPVALLHDLRTPLGQMIGYAELLLERAEEEGDERSAPDLRKVVAAGRQMAALMDEHLTGPSRADADGGG